MAAATAASGKRSFKAYVEQELGKFPKFIIYVLLEWLLILLLFIDGFLAFACNEFARFFEMQMPCILCTRIDHNLVRRPSDFYYNESVCHAHKKQVSSLAFCHVHKQLSDIRKMCEGCLLSFATEKDSDCFTYKSLVGILHKDLDCFIPTDDLSQVQLPLPKKNNNVVPVAGATVNLDCGERCSCCGEPLRMKRKGSSGMKPQPPPPSAPGKSPSPRAFVGPNVVLPPIRFTEMKFVDVVESEMPTPDEAAPTAATTTVSVPLIADAEDITEAIRTPTYGRPTKFVGISLSDPAAGASPRWSARAMRKSTLDKTESAAASDPTDEAETLNNLKRQVRLDRTSLMALYMELDEERSASAVAANNAMAMITRLQAEKAAVQMEALQYQRMMDEQAEYDQEALQEMHTLLIKREEQVKVFETELKAYQNKYGFLNEEDFDIIDDEYEDLAPYPFSTEEDDEEEQARVEEKEQEEEQEQELPPPTETMRTLKKIGGFRQHNGGRNKFPDIDNLVSTEA